MLRGAIAIAREGDDDDVDSPPGWRSGSRFANSHKTPDISATIKRMKSLFTTFAITAALFIQAPAPTAPAPSTPSGCTPQSNKGTCYEPGERCRNSDHGASGVSGGGENIVCANNDGWRWEPAS
jgi:hypothetical protein